MAIGKKDSLDNVLDRKSQKCGRCGNFMAITVECPLRKGRDNAYVCWHCCTYKCRYAKEEEMPWGKRKYCGVKRNIQAARQKEAAENKRKKAAPPRQQQTEI